MLTKIEIYTEQGTMLELPIQSPNGYLVKDIAGLDPSKANIVSSPFALLDGAKYQASRIETRNIIFTIRPQPDYVTKTVDSLRSDLYLFFMPKSKITMKFFREGKPTVEIVGYVESLETLLFTQSPEIVISVICMNPSFANISEMSLPVTPGAFISTSGVDAESVSYAGSIETGFIFSMTLPVGSAPLSSFALKHSFPSGGESVLNFVGGLIAEDTVVINTVSGNKYAYLTRAGATSSVLYAISPSSKWIKLYPGSNNLSVYAVRTAGEEIPWSIVYSDKFGGL